MEYNRLSKSYAYGLHRIYEMVINNDPSYAYLLESNNLVDQKLVMAHVYGHCHFFKHNASFAKTNRKMMDAMGMHAAKVERYQRIHGLEVVENFIDTCLMLDDLIDPHSVFIKRADVKERSLMHPDDEERPHAQKIKSKEYMNEFINPPEALRREQEFLDAEYAHKKLARQKQQFPEEPQKDILLFLVEHAQLEEWQLDILWMIREEAYYFAPQAETKIMNEGWATYWHEKLMTERLLTDAEVIDFADHHSGTVAAHPGQINPYRLGFELWKDIEDRWNKGKFGSAYDDCDDYMKRKNWDLQLGQGREKIFSVCKTHNDITFIDAFFNEEFCYEHKYFVYEYDSEHKVYEVVSRDWKDVKEGLLFALTNRGKPFIYVVNGNHENRGELLLQHRHEGRDLHERYAKATLQGLYKMWKRPVHIQTIFENKEKTLSFNGKEHKK